MLVIFVLDGADALAAFPLTPLNGKARNIWKCDLWCVLTYFPICISEMDLERKIPYLKPLSYLSPLCVPHWLWSCSHAVFGTGRIEGNQNTSQVGCLHSKQRNHFQHQSKDHVKYNEWLFVTGKKMLWTRGQQPRRSSRLYLGSSKDTFRLHFSSQPCLLAPVCPWTLSSLGF